MDFLNPARWKKPKGYANGVSAIGRHLPAMAMVQVADLIEDQAKVEVETTAIVPE